MRLITIVKPPSIMRAELMKKRGIMPTWPMAMLAMQSIMQRKRVNITLRNTGRKNRNHGRSAQCRSQKGDLSRDNNGRQWRFARRLHRTGEQKCPFVFIWRHGGLRFFLPAELRLRSKREAQVDLPQGRMWNQAPPHKRTIARGQGRKIKVPLAPRLAPRAPRRNPGLKAGAPVKALAKVLRRPETKATAERKGRALLAHSAPHPVALVRYRSRNAIMLISVRPRREATREAAVGVIFQILSHFEVALQVRQRLPGPLFQRGIVPLFAYRLNKDTASLWALTWSLSYCFVKSAPFRLLSLSSIFW